MAYMGRIILLLLIIAAVVLVWKAFGPSSWNQKKTPTVAPPREIKGPDDDEDFLWQLEKEAFKQRRQRERAAEEKRPPKPKNQNNAADTPDTSDSPDSLNPGEKPDSGEDSPQA